MKAQRRRHQAVEATSANAAARAEVGALNQRATAHVTKVLASQPVPAMPESARNRIEAALAAEAAKRRHVRVPHPRSAARTVATRSEHD